jgi:hypothetical protein
MQILTCIDPTVAMPENELEAQLLSSLFRSQCFQDFLRRQIAFAEKIEKDVDPRGGKVNAESFFQIVKDARLLARFWQDFLNYSQDLGNEVE